MSNLTWEVTAPDAAVHTWYDQSGNSNNATQGTAAAQPLFAENGNLIDSGKSLSGDDSQQHLDFGSSITLTGDFSIFYKSDPAARSAVLGTGTGTTPRFEHSSSSVIRFATGTNYDFSVTGTSFSNAVISLVRNTSDSATLNQNGTLKDTKTVDSHASFTFAQLFAFGTNVNQLDGKFSEIIIYNFDQSNNRFKIESNMNNHYEVYEASQNGFVETWFDQSGNGNNAVQSAEDEQPSIVENGNLLADGLKFDGVDDVLSGTTLTSMASGAVFYVFKSTSTARSQLFQFSKGTDYGVSATVNTNSVDGRLATSADASNDSRSGPVFEATGVTTNEQHLLSLILDSDTHITTANIDGASMSTPATEDGRFDVGVSVLSIGQRGDDSFAEENLVSEVVIYTSDQSGNLSKIETNIINHYGIT